MNGLINSAYDSLISRINGAIQTWVMNGVIKLTAFINESLFSAFQEPMIASLLDFGMWISRLVFAASFVVVLIDLAEEASSFKSDQFKVIEWPTVFWNTVKTLIFIELAPRAAIMAMQVSSKMVGQLDTAQYFSTGYVGALSNWQLITILIAIAGFTCVSMMRFGAMLIQAFTPFLYVADMMRGHMSSMGDWLRQTIAIALTFFLQHILFFQGTVCFSTGSPLVGGMLWLTMFFVSKYLTKFGISSGVTGALSSANGMAQNALGTMDKISHLGA